MNNEQTARTATDRMVDAAIEREDRKKNMNKFRSNLEFELARNNAQRILDLEARIEIWAILADKEKTAEELLFDVRMAIRNKQFDLATKKLRPAEVINAIEEINRLNIQRDVLLEFAK